MICKISISVRKKLNINCVRRYEKKKRGFTLIEVIAVIAIIGILAASILPRVSGYVKEAKKTKVVDQCRKVVMAVESYNLTSSTPLAKTAKVSTVTTTAGANKYLSGDGEALSNIDTANTTIQRCYDIVGGAEFDIDNQEKLSVSGGISNQNSTPS